MKPLTRKLIGGVRESHTKEHLFKKSGPTSGFERRSKRRAQEQQERENQRKNSSFRVERERVRREMPPGGMGPTQEGGWRGQGAGPRHLAFWLGGGPPWSATGALWWPFTWKLQI